MSSACSYEGCTVGDTGKCALENDPATCVHRFAALSMAGGSTPVYEGASDAGAPVLDAPEELPAFPLSTTLGSDAIETMMGSRYVTIVGILGDPESGKTACLASLYLLVSNDLLKGWSFADSRSLIGFENIARGARWWNEGHPPEQMTVHTEMADDRVPGFFHLRLKRKVDGHRVDLALPDLPGEWTKAMVRVSRTDRLAFLHSADVIWLVIDGKALLDKEQRQGCITRLGQLVGRLTEMIKDRPLPKLLLVITHQDAGIPDEAVIGRLHTELAKHGAKADVVPVASFARKKAKVKAGSGLEDLINATVSQAGSSGEFWPSTEPAESIRAYLSFRRGLDG